MSLVEHKTTLRKTLRNARRQLSSSQQTEASYRFVDTVSDYFGPIKPKRIALYLAMDGELDLAPFIEQCRAWHTDVYLPVLHRYQPTLWFARYDQDSALYNNRFSIPEPIHSDPIRPWQLNVVMFPLVGFDPQGGRLGMGGGFYDRTFANAPRWPRQPKMIGVAHECQKVAELPLESWDIRLNAIISDQRAYPVDG